MSTAAGWSPNFYVPGILGAKMIRGDIEHMMSAVVARIDGATSAKRGAPRAGHAGRPRHARRHRANQAR